MRLSESEGRERRGEKPRRHGQRDQPVEYLSGTHGSVSQVERNCANRLLITIAPFRHLLDCAARALLHFVNAEGF
jgi:hypothetical protein